jgi:hypothetical protein
MVYKNLDRKERKMTNIQEKTREQLLRVVNDIIYMAHRIRVPSNNVKNIFVDQILRLDELKERFGLEEETEEGVEEKAD